MTDQTIDIERARRETPGCAHVIHLNNAGAGLMPKPVVDAQVAHLQREAEIGGYEAADEACSALSRSYDAVAELLGCDRDEVAIVENATVAWRAAFYGVTFQPGDRILTAQAEYASNYISFLQVARHTGAHIDVIPSDDRGQVDVAALEQMIDDRVKLIAITHVPTNSGLVNPAHEVGAIARSAGVLFLLDACQSAGQLALDVDHIGCDMLSATGRKYLRGPRGVGFLYVRRAALDRIHPPQLDLHAATWVAPDRYEMRPDARRFENWEANQAAKIGLGVAIDYALSFGIDAIETRVTALAASLRAGLTEIGATVTDIGARRCGIVSFATRVSATEVCERLRAQRINVSVSTRSSTLIDMDRRGLDEIVRASVHYYNTEDEISRFCSAVQAL